MDLPNIPKLEQSLEKEKGIDIDFDDAIREYLKNKITDSEQEKER